MKKIVLLFVPLLSMGQCPTATEVFTSTCKSSPNGYFEQGVVIRPAITNTTSSVNYSWSIPPGVLLSGQTNQPTLATDYPGTYTLTITDLCTVITTHTVEKCPPGTNYVGLEEYRANEYPTTYFDLYGNRVERTTGVLIIEQCGNRRRKIIIQ